MARPGILGGFRAVLRFAESENRRKFKHPVKPGRVTIAGHPSQEMDKGTISSILKQAGLK
jgi:hypothetical protein